MGSETVAEKSGGCEIDDQFICVLKSIDSRDDRKRCLDPKCMSLMPREDEEKKSFLKPEVRPKSPDETFFSLYWDAIKVNDIVPANSNGIRICVVGDPGVGKSRLLKKIREELKLKGNLCIDIDETEYLSFEFKSTSLNDSQERLLLYVARFLVANSQRDQSKSPFIPTEILIPCVVDELRGYAERHNLWIFIDSPTSIPKDIVSLLNDTNQGAANSINFVIGSRSDFVIRFWDDVFYNKSWRFVRVSPFTRRQQIEYLERNFPRDARNLMALNLPRDLLANPRSLEKLAKLHQRHSIRTATDLFALSVIDSLDSTIDQRFSKIEMQSNRSKKVRFSKYSDRQDIRFQDLPRYAELGASEVMEFLSRIAYNCLKANNTRGSFASFSCNIPDLSIPEFSYYLDLILKECSVDARKNSKAVIDVVKALSDLLFTKFDEGEKAFRRRVVWSDPQIQEFLLAYYFSNFASLEESNALSAVVFLPWENATLGYYHFWKFICEMPSHCRTAEVWLNSISVLYRRASIRSNEMIYRSWETLKSYTQHPIPKIKELANSIRDAWWSEFSYISGDARDGRMSVALRLKRDFLSIPPSREFFKSSDEKTFTLSQDQNWQVKYLDVLKDKYKKEVLNGKDSIHQSELLDGIAEAYHFCLTKPVKLHVEKFQLRRRTVSRSEYRLYDPGFVDYIESQDNIQDLYKDDLPVVEISFYDAWVFCQWLRWDGSSCRLPWELEWEYAAKLGFKENQNYWWDDSSVASGGVRSEVISLESFVEGEVPKPRVPSKDRSSAKSKDLDSKDEGLMDMQGNVLEWCQDLYERAYPENDQDLSAKHRNDSDCNAEGHRVLRGGGFDFIYDPFASVSYRHYSLPGIRGKMAGIRVARDIESE